MTQEKTTPGSGRDNRVLWTALLILVGFTVLTVWMLATTDSGETQWARQAFVFGSVEAIVFAAVGWLFGREVHRGQAESARTDAEEARREASAEREKSEEAFRQASDEKVKGEAVAAGVRVAAASSTPDGGDVQLTGSGAGGGASQETSSMEALQALVDELYPRRP